MPRPWQTADRAHLERPTLTRTAASPAAHAQRQLRLARGQSLRLWLPEGAAILSQSPRLAVITPPLYLGAQLSFRREDLEDGQVLSLPQAGWVELHAPAGGNVLCMWPLPVSWPDRLAAAWAKLLGRPRLDAPFP